MNLGHEPPGAQPPPHSDADAPPSARVVPIRSIPAPQPRAQTAVGQASPLRVFANTDTGNAERLVARYGEDLKYCHAWGKWLVWDGLRWFPDDSAQVERWAKNTVRSIYREAANIDHPELRKATALWARKSESASARRGLLSCASSEVPVKVTDLDADPWLLNVQNGTIDLRTGELDQHRRETLITKLAPFDYEPDATCPLWETFLAEVQPDPTVRAYLQRMAGYGLTGVIREQFFPVHHGVGRNGKGVYINTVLRLMGDYARQVPTELLMEKRGEAHPTERAVLFGCRFAAAVETEEGRSLNVGLVKQLTGGDQIAARLMRQDFFEFWPTHKLWLSTNHKPRIKETKDAIWERVHMIPWAVTIPEARRDLKLGEKLMAESAGILAWLVRGCSAWQREGLAAPSAVRMATQAYRTGEDTVGDFVADRCRLEADRHVTVRELRESYEGWCAETGEKNPLSPRAFNERIENRGPRRIAKRTDGIVTKVWDGIRFRRPEESIGPEG